MAAFVQSSLPPPDPVDTLPTSTQTQTQSHQTRRNNNSRASARGGRRSNRRGRGGAANNRSVVDDAAASLDGRGRQQTERGGRPAGRRAERGAERGRGRRGRARQEPQLPHNPTGRTEMAAARTFGGRLTRPETTHVESEPPFTTSSHHPQTEPDSASLRPNAPSFVPGQPTSARSSAENDNPTVHFKERRRPNRREKVHTKSTAEDIPTRTHEDISNGFYECPICTSELGRRSKVWSCRQCWTVFHLGCIKKWSKNEGSALSRPRGQEGESSDYIRQWRCPGCNLPHDVLPSVYTCWCEKEMDPRFLPGLPPHSCGQTCSRKRKDCPHPCDSICHAGPCAPCTAMGPTQHCFCGKHESTKRCADTNYEKGWSCQEECGELLPCLEHTCHRPCHEGLCGECEEIVTATCYCGEVTKDIACNFKDDEIPSENQSETWIGAFNCGCICSRPYDCGEHACQERCHPQDKETPHCPLSPDLISHCPCGKTLLSEIPGAPRKNCTDPVPNCTKPCGKLLSCQHSCPQPCHDGPCPPCYLRMDITCRCGRVTAQTLCSGGEAEPPMCMRVCKATMNCGRHVCGERCCTGERKSVERLATKRKLKSLMAVNQIDDNDIEAEHICTEVCGRILKCGIHRCPDLCHRGACSTCREAIFEEISCNCGRSVLYPPQPCGTRPPPCNFNCERPKSCGHPPTQHNCHGDEESCPKCPYLTEKRCMCGKKILKNQPCWLNEARCGQICDKELQCGSHKCRKPCHRLGDCEDSKEPCQQPCGKPKKSCSHQCTDACHAPFPCTEKSPCQSVVSSTCPCGRLLKEKRCNAFKDKGQPQLPSLTPLKCDEECGRLQRNRTLASALSVDIDPLTTATATSSSPLDLLPYSDDTLDIYLELSSSSTLSTLQSYESSLHSLATSTQRSTRFRPARSQLRAFTHLLAEDWGFETESFDPEPSRHVLVFKPPAWIPPPATGPPHTSGIGIRGLSVAECIKLRVRERAKERTAAAEKAKLHAAMKHHSPDDAASGAVAHDGGWAQVASRKRPTANNTLVGFNNGDGKGSGSGSAPRYSNGFGLLGIVAPEEGRFGKLVLRSGVGMGRSKKVDLDEVSDDWEVEVEREEREEDRKRQADTTKTEEHVCETSSGEYADPPSHSVEQSVDVKEKGEE